MKTIQRKDFLSLLAKSNNKKRRKLIADWAEKKDMDALGEVSLNTLRGNVKLSPSLLRKLKRHRKAIRMLASKKVKLCQKKKKCYLLIQKLKKL